MQHKHAMQCTRPGWGCLGEMQDLDLCPNPAPAVTLDRAWHTTHNFSESRRQRNVQTQDMHIHMHIFIIINIYMHFQHAVRSTILQSSPHASFVRAPSRIDIMMHRIPPLPRIANSLSRITSAPCSAICNAKKQQNRKSTHTTWPSGLVQTVESGLSDAHAGLHLKITFPVSFSLPFIPSLLFASKQVSNMMRI